MVFFFFDKLDLGERILSFLGGAVRPKSPTAAAPMLLASGLLAAWQLQAGSYVLSFLAGGLTVLMGVALAGGLKPADVARAAVAPLGFCVYVGHVYGGLPQEALPMSWFFMAVCARR